MTNSIFVAIDVGSRSHQVAVGGADGELITEFTISHQREGFEDFFARIESLQASHVQVAMEVYNGWARPLDQQILARGWPLYNVNNLKLARYKEIFPAPAKTDAIDARRMLELFSLREHRSLGRDVLEQVMLGSEAQRQLKYLTRHRRRLVDERARLITRLQGDLLAVCPALLALAHAVENRWFLNFVTCRERLTLLPKLHESTLRKLSGVGDKTLLRIQAWQREAKFYGDIDLTDEDIVNDAKALQLLRARIADFNQRIEAVSVQSPMAQHIQSLPGFGNTGSAELSGEIGNLARFNAEAGLAMYLGMAPLDRSSGTKQGGIRPACVNRRCQQAMMTCVCRHMAAVPKARAYYDKKRQQGKSHNQAVRALGRHLVRVIWRMLTDERDYEVRSESAHFEDEKMRKIA